METINLNDYQTFVMTSATDFISKINQKPRAQRLLDQNHVQEIVDFQITYYNMYKRFYFGNSFITAKLNQNLYLLDGQHRLESLKRLIKFFDLKDYPIIYQCNIVKNKQEMNTLFEVINKNHQLAGWITELFDLPSEEKEIALTNKDRVDCILKIFDDKFPGILRMTNKPQKPNISRDFFSEKLMNDLLLHQEGVDKYWLKLLEENNIFKQQKFNPDKFSANALKKIEKTNCYIGLFDIKNRKEKIPAAVRNVLWNRSYPDDRFGKCAACQYQLDIMNFEAGHIQAEACGGLVNLDNLVILCSGCNKSMGIQNFNEFKQKYFS